MFVKGHTSSSISTGMLFAIKHFLTLLIVLIEALNLRFPLSDPIKPYSFHAWSSERINTIFVFFMSVLMALVLSGSDNL